MSIVTVSSARSTPVLGVLVVVLLGASGLVACGDEPSPGHSRDAAIYTSMIRWIVDNHPPEMDDSGGMPTVYIEPLGDGLPLQVQVEVIDLLTDEVTLRFTDRREEAVANDDDLRPVAPGSILVGLAPVPTGDPVVVRGEVYRSVDEIDAYLMTVGTRADDVWDVVGTPEAVPAEGLALVTD